VSEVMEAKFLDLRSSQGWNEYPIYEMCAPNGKIRSLNDERLQAAALLAVAGCLWGRGKLREAYELFDASWEMGDRSKDLQAIGNAISMGSFSLNWLRDARALKAWVSRELAKPRQERNPARGIPLHFAVIGHAMAGDIAEGRRVQFECQSRYPATAKYNAPWLHYVEGDFQGSDAGYLSYINLARRQGRRENVCCFGFLLGCSQITSRNYQGAEASFSEALSIASGRTRPLPTKCLGRLGAYLCADEST
jgi:hypothetical protein